LLTRERAAETGVFPAAVLAAVADVLDDHGGRGVHLSVPRCGNLPEVAGTPQTLHQLIVTMAYYAIVQAEPGGTVVVSAEHRTSDETVAFTVADDGAEEPELSCTRPAILRGRELACAVARHVLAGLGGSVEVERRGDRTCIVMVVPTLP
jgi:hypothetical protein